MKDLALQQKAVTIPMIFDVLIAMNLKYVYEIPKVLSFSFWKPQFLKNVLNAINKYVNTPTQTILQYADGTFLS